MSYMSNSYKLPLLDSEEVSNHLDEAGRQAYTTILLYEKWVASTTVNLISCRAAKRGKAHYFFLKKNEN